MRALALFLAGLLVSSGAFSDSIVVDGTKYEAVHVRETDRMYYISIPSEGKTISVLKAKVRPEDVVISPDEGIRSRLLQKWKAKKAEEQAERMSLFKEIAGEYDRGGDLAEAQNRVAQEHGITEDMVDSVMNEGWRKKWPSWDLLVDKDLSVEEKKRIFKEIVAEKDKGGDPIQAQNRVARKHAFDRRTILRIMREGAKNGWPLPERTPQPEKVPPAKDVSPPARGLSTSSVFSRRVDSAYQGAHSGEKQAGGGRARVPVLKTRGTDHRTLEVLTVQLSRS